jgi:signal transduction histidine kinase
MAKIAKNIDEETSVNNRRALTIRFCVAAVLAITLAVMLVTAASFWQIKKYSVNGSLQRFEDTVVKPILTPERIQFDFKQPALLAEVWSDIKKEPNIIEATFYDRQFRALVPRPPRSVITQKERAVANDILEGRSNSVAIDKHRPAFSARMDDLFGKDNRPISGIIGLKDRSGTTHGYLKVVGNYSSTIQGAKQAAIKIFWYNLAGSALLFLALFYNFRKGLQTIETQEKKLSQQIARLSNLLLINKNMQKSMKTASARAVELNEQFLRRVGSDLHDGPAQSIGYAVLRLDKISKEEQAREFGHDFHVVKEALNSSLDEIRGISTGLVLPELAKMTLQQSLEQVVGRHASNSNSMVAQYYQDLPDDIPVPIKICAYRFIQEGLNNAHRHGQAEKCRVNAYVKDGVLHLTLKDNGIGFRKSQLRTDSGHLGLMGLKDRIESLGGKFSINSELGVGTAIKVSVAIYDEV